MKAFMTRSSITRAGTGSNACLPSMPKTERARAKTSDALLAGKLFDDRGNRMSPSHATKRGCRYRYYVSQAILQGRKADAGSVARVPAKELERRVVEAVRGAAPTDRRERSIETRITRHVSSTPPLLRTQPLRSRRLHARSELPTGHVDPKSQRLALVLFGASCSVDHSSRDRFLLDSKMVAQQLVAGNVARVHSRN